MRSPHLIIDTDTAADDCVALLIGLLDPEATLEAITMVAGNIGFEQQVRNAFLTLNVAGRLGQVPVHLGATRPMMREWVSAEEVHGDGAGGLAMDVADCEPSPEHAVDALLRLTAAHPGEVDIVAIGPLTNIALAVLTDTAFATRVRSLVIMGGSNNARGNITAAAEYNFYVDPEAARIVFGAGFDITVVPWAPLTVRDAVFDRETYARIAEIDTPLARFFHRVNQATLEFDESVGLPGATHPDSLSAAVLLHPELVLESARYNVQIETASELTRGYSAMSWGVHGLDANATVIERIDAAGFERYLLDLLAIDTIADRDVQGGV